VSELPDRTDKPIYSGSKLERLLRMGHFVVTADWGPPASADPNDFIEQTSGFRDLVDVVHVADLGGAMPGMCGIAGAALLERLGVETLLHMTCRDRNRLKLQADILGAHALGVRNLLCMTGDHPLIGDHPEARPVFDLDSIALTEMVRRMRDEGTLDSGRPLKAAPKVFIGGAVAPTAPPLDFRPHRLAKKIAAGVDFVISQQIFDMDLLGQYMRQVCDMGLNEKVYTLIGVGALPGPELARWNSENIPGVVVPEPVIQRLRGVPEKRRRSEGIRICVEQIEQLREMAGVSGICIMTNEHEGWVPTLEIIEAAGLSERPILADEIETEAC
jgi:methylenetetrahydrofolate reductase (NADPH)